MAESSAGKTLRAAVKNGAIQVPGAFNALVGRIAETAGFKAVYLSGAAFSAGELALPDIGLSTLSELVEQTRRLTRAIEIPVIVDADTGFGEAINVERTVRELEAAGAAAIQLEDQRLPKRCGHLAGKSLVEPNEMCAKLRAAAAARSDNRLVIIARTDARGVDGLHSAVDRAKMYVDAGADWIFPEALTSGDEFAQFARAIRVPLVANMTEFGQSPLLGLKELSDLGYAAVIYPVTLLRLAMKSVQLALDEIAARGSQSDLLSQMQTRQELYELLRYDEFQQRDQKFAK